MNEVNRAENFEKTLKLTDKGLKFYEFFTKFNHKKLIQNAIVLNIGGGFTQKFEKELKEKRPDVRVITIDPSIFQNEYRMATDKEADIIYDDSKAKKPRLKKLFNKKNTIVAFGQAIPLSDNLIDEAVDIQAAAQYSTNEEEYKKYLSEIIRVLKPGGKLNIGNVFNGDPILGDPESEKNLVAYTDKIFFKLGLNAEVYVVEIGKSTDPKGKIVPDRRICATITKK